MTKSLSQKPPKVLMIDNYDSFTWNLYQYLCLLGANVTVIRSQSCSLEELVLNYPDISHLVISPGPGHPTTDSGISIPALLHFAGKIPILGICMGLQCIYSAYGGSVLKAGEIVHGKTSPVSHDRSGLFKGIAQSIQSTRYHSLAGQFGSLPPELMVTSWTSPNSKSTDPQPFDGQSSIIMGIRHKTFTVEAVQYHPESILSDEGKPLLSNFLSLKGGLWSENPGFLDPIPPTKINDQDSQSSSGSKLPTILQKICNQRTLDIQEAKKIPGGSPSDLKRKLASNVPPPQIDFYQRLSKDCSQRMALMAEIKRASPSKGSFVNDSTPTPPEIAISYAAAGASVISVLTEPTWFRGTLLDMLQVRLSLESVPNRPAILRKDFILDPYQIDEARCFGADTILLIVACLSDEKLESLFKYSKKLGMEPLVEVNNADELKKALSIGARVIGVNNRNLHNFDVDMKTTSDMVRAYRDYSSKLGGSSEGVIMCALSGISCRADVERYRKDGVGAVLVGESMMKAQNKASFVRELLCSSDGYSSSKSLTLKQKTMVKICGITTPEDAIHAVKSGADLIGLIFVPKSKRYVEPSQASLIIKSVRKYQEDKGSSTSSSEDQTFLSISSNVSKSKDWFSLNASRLSSIPVAQKPLIVGVFQDSSLEEIQNVLNSLGGGQALDLIQLHGNEPIEFAKFLTLPVIKTFHFPIVEASSYKGSNIQPDDNQEIFRPGYHALPLVDSKSINQIGGTGKTFDWNDSKILQLVSKYKGEGGEDKEEEEKNFLILAGGLNINNVVEGIKIFKPLIVDVCGGVEADCKGEDGKKSEVKKDFKKIEEFIKAVKMN
ncbi:anthranilate synthase component 2 [Phakopsora pachyrhizi]|uniref:Multifunctional tryptophan biosynthesis protein n=1 Tax=Phakopsora pachyrhizi TaxID=170000 RepID=A0AAV0BGM5_PHAPC|nr:anthranilate synthase component 2 [Phakopsora pachyrhizi]CAH7686115.1 anthranilate synthase component 2 [Phakopsora pachyrhizi]